MNKGMWKEGKGSRKRDGKKVKERETQTEIWDERGRVYVGVCDRGWLADFSLCNSPSPFPVGSIGRAREVEFHTRAVEGAEESGKGTVERGSREGLVGEGRE